jgi:hypothetical protein
MSLTDFSEQSRVNPLDVVERVATTNSWSFERAGDDEITILVTGKWTDYQVSYTWMFDIEALHLACAFELKVPERNRAEVQQLISLINEQMWVGHFDLWTKDGIVMYRHALILAGGVEAFEPAMRGAARDRARRLRALFPGVPVRGLGRQACARSARRRHVRDARSGVSSPLSSVTERAMSTSATPRPHPLAELCRLAPARSAPARWERLLEGWLALGSPREYRRARAGARRPADRAGRRGVRLNPPRDGSARSPRGGRGQAAGRARGACRRSRRSWRPTGSSRSWRAGPCAFSSRACRARAHSRHAEHARRHRPRHHRRGRQRARLARAARARDTLLSAVGAVEWAPDEALMDAVTALSGSGRPMFPAGRGDGARRRRRRLPPALRATLARATVAGAGELLHRSPLDAATLRQNVTSPAAPPPPRSTC